MCPGLSWHNITQKGCIVAQDCISHGSYSEGQGEDLCLRYRDNICMILQIFQNYSQLFMCAFLYIYIAQSAKYLSTLQRIDRLSVPHLDPGERVPGLPVGGHYTSQVTNTETHDQPYLPKKLF